MIDAHIHYSGDTPETLRLLEQYDLKLLNICVAAGEWHPQIGLYRELKKSHADRYAWCTSFDLPDYTVSDREYASMVIAGLRRDFADGAIAVKAWKNIGMELTDHDGRFVLIDDEIFDPVYEYLVRESMPILMHIGEPLECWQPLREGSVHYGYYSKNPEWHMYNKPDYPSHAELIDARDRVMGKHPKLRLIGAHLGSLEYDVAEVAKRFELYPNFAVDVSARLGDLMAQDPRTVREFMLAYSDRVLFGTDIVNRKRHSEMAPDELDEILAKTRATYDAYTRYFGTEEEVSFAGQTSKGLGLPADVLEKFYVTNAQTWYPGL